MRRIHPSPLRYPRRFLGRYLASLSVPSVIRLAAGGTDG